MLYTKCAELVFSLSIMGKSILKDRSDGKKRQSEFKKMKTFFLPVNKAANKISASVSSQSAQQSLHSFVCTSQAIVTEVIWVFKTVSFGHSLGSNERLLSVSKNLSR